MNFSWKNPDESHVITLKFLYEECQTIQSIDIDPDQVNSKEQLTLVLKNGSRLKLELLNQLIEDTRVITIQPEPEHPMEETL